MENEISNNLFSKARYVVHITVFDPNLFDDILCEIFVREYGYQLPGVTLPATKGESGKIERWFVYRSLSYGHAAIRAGIDYTYYNSRNPPFHSLISNISKKEVLDRHINEAIDLYSKQKNDKPEISRKVKSEIIL